VPREARVVTERLSDFADFMRSTAPTSEIQGTPYTIAASPGSSKVTTPQKKPGPRMEARGASIKGGGSDDLIDFIRKGPPGGENGEHRIPRTIAPFRSTMDSDDFKDLGPASANGVNGMRNGARQAPTSAPASAPTSAPPSYSSSTVAQRRPPPVQSAFPGPKSALGAPFGEGPPERKRHRVKDQYALDFLDEDDDDFLMALPSSESRQRPREESLAEFLMATDPPSARPPPPSQPSSNSRANNYNSSARPAAVTSSASSGFTPSVPKKRFEARAAGRTTNFGEAPASTFDMADFLRSSGPIESSSAPAPDIPASRSGRSDIHSSSGMSDRGSTKKGGSGRRFWQRKTYLDMP
jgi:hypothetical protein